MLYVERVGDELLLTVQDDDEPDGDGIIVALPIPDGTDELLEAVRRKVEGI